MLESVPTERLLVSDTNAVSYKLVSDDLIRDDPEVRTVRGLTPTSRGQRQRERERQREKETSSASNVRGAATLVWRTDNVRGKDNV